MNVDELKKNFETYYKNFSTLNDFCKKIYANFKTVLDKDDLMVNNFDNKTIMTVLDTEYNTIDELKQVISQTPLLTKTKTKTKNKKKEKEKETIINQTIINNTIIDYCIFQYIKTICMNLQYEFMIKTINCLIDIIQILFECFQADLDNQKLKEIDEKLNYIQTKYLIPIFCTYSDKAGFLSYTDDYSGEKAKILNAKINYIYEYSIKLWTLGAKLNTTNIVPSIDEDLKIDNNFETFFKKSAYVDPVFTEDKKNIPNIYFEKYKKQNEAYSKNYFELDDKFLESDNIKDIIIYSINPPPKDYDHSKFSKTFEYTGSIFCPSKNASIFEIKNLNASIFENKNLEKVLIEDENDPYWWYKQIFLLIIKQINNRGYKFLLATDTRLPEDRLLNDIDYLKTIIGQCETTVKSASNFVEEPSTEENVTSFNPGEKSKKVVDTAGEYIIPAYNNEYMQVLTEGGKKKKTRRRHRLTKRKTMKKRRKTMKKRRSKFIVYV